MHSMAARILAVVLSVTRNSRRVPIATVTVRDRGGDGVVWRRLSEHAPAVCARHMLILYRRHRQHLGEIGTQIPRDSTIRWGFNRTRNLDAPPRAYPPRRRDCSSP